MKETALQVFMFKCSCIFKDTWGFFHLFLIIIMSSNKTKESDIAIIVQVSLLSVNTELEFLPLIAGMTQGGSWISDHFVTYFLSGSEI